jgi:hypothetical protein
MVHANSSFQFSLSLNFLAYTSLLGQLETIRRAIEGHSIDKLTPLCNGKGTVDVTLIRRRHSCHEGRHKRTAIARNLQP